MNGHSTEKVLRERLRRAWFSVWRTEVDLTIVRWFAHRFGWHTNACRGCDACRPDFDARWRPNGWWSNRTRAGENPRQTLRERLYVALVEQRVIDSRHFGEAPYAPVTWEDVDRVIPPAETSAS